MKHRRDAGDEIRKPWNHMNKYMPLAVARNVGEEILHKQSIVPQRLSKFPGMGTDVESHIVLSGPISF